MRSNLIPLLCAAYATLMASGCAGLFERDSNSIPEDRMPRRTDVAVGMTMDEVARRWGEPRRVYSAGNNSSGHQKWEYTDGPSSSWGFAPTRTVYFENGRVAGWQTRARTSHY